MKFLDNKATFGAERQKVGVNASFYDSRYVSTHNKIVYTPENSEEAKRFGDDLKKSRVALPRERFSPSLD